MDVFLIDLYFKYDYKARDHCKVWSSIMTYFISGNNIIKGQVHIKSKLIHYVCFSLQCSYDVSRKNGGVGDHHLLQCLVPCTESEHSCTIKPVYKGHSLEHANAALMSSCPFLYTG